MSSIPVNSDLLGAILAILMAVLLLAFRHFLSTSGKSRRGRYKAQQSTPGTNRFELRKPVAERGKQIRLAQEPAPELSFISVDEFLAELHAEARGHSRTLKDKNDSAPDSENGQSHLSHAPRRAL